MLPIDTESYDYRFNKTLNEDVQLKPNTYHKYDIQIENGDYVNVTGKESLYNAIIIAILTRYNEIKNNLYEEFGCRAHDLIKANKSEMTRYKIEIFVEETLENMRRISEINYLEIKESETHLYNVNFSVTSINDELIKGEVTL